MKKCIIVCTLLFMMNVQSHEVASAGCIEQIQQELDRVKTEASQQYDECAKHKDYFLPQREKNA